MQKKPSAKSAKPKSSATGKSTINASQSKTSRAKSVVARSGSPKKPAGKATARKATTAKTSARKVPAPIVSTGFWLFKSEPDVFSWEMLKAKGAAGEEWNGVRNYLARNNMRAMAIGDLGFFYHSNDGKEIVGIVRVCREAEQDTTTDDARWQCVKLEAVCDVAKPVTLADVKASDELSQMSLVTSMRLSVQPITPREWQIVCRMAGVDPKKLA